MSKRPSVKARGTLADEAREAALDSAAATLAAIHMAKKVGAEAMPSGDCAADKGSLPRDFRLPLGDVLFGVAQIQVDFARRLFEFNKAASTHLKKRLKTARSGRVDRQILRVKAAADSQVEVRFTVRNSASLARVLEFEVSAGERAAYFLTDGAKSTKDGSKQRLSVSSPSFKARATIAAGDAIEVQAQFSGLFPKGTHTGHIDITCNDVLVERLPLEITVE